MIAVTGAAGFLGSAVCRLAAEPVVALVHRPGPAPPEKASRVFVGDICDADTLDRALDGAKAVVHLAALHVDREGAGYERVNLEGARAVLAAMRRNRVRRILIVSSTGVYGHGRHAGADERTPVRPDTALARSKAAAEALLLEAHRRGELELTLLRHRFVYGHGDRHVLPGIHRAAARAPFLVDGGRARFSLIWVDDLARVIWRLIGEPEPDAERPLYHVTDGAPVAYVDLVEALCRGLGGRPPTRSLPFWLVHTALRVRERLADVDLEAASGVTSLRVALLGRDQWFSNERLRRRLPDFAATPLTVGLAASMDWYRSLAK